MSRVEKWWRAALLFLLASVALIVSSDDARAEFSCATYPAPPGKYRDSALVGETANALGEKRILFYRVDFSDSVGAAIASNSAATLLIDLNTYYRDMSYGLMTVAAPQAGSLITETLRLPEGSTNYNNNFTKLIEATRQVATQAGYDPSAFDSDVISTGTKPFLAAGSVAYVGGPGVWLGNNNFNVGVLGHEFGHNLGLPHASSWFTSDQSSIGPGVKEEYGDPFDSMGVPGGSTSHFNVRFKNSLQWIPDADAPVVTANGTYRLKAQDDPASTGLRALRVPRSSSLNYWVEFRRSFANRWVTNGATLRLADNVSSNNTLLLDTTPGTSNLKQDSPLVLGRTFSDRCNDIHITVLGKAGTTPEALDVVVNRGPFPGNVAPTVTVGASATTVTQSQVVTLQATASDANGDPLAYYWDFGDGNFGMSQPTIDHGWNISGEYVAHCIVTDMKGGTAGASVVIRVGTVTTFAVQGTVRSNGVPLEGAYVKSGSRYTFSNTDGSYYLSRLSAGRQTVSVVLDGYKIFNAGFENPVTLGPNVTGSDFEAIPFSLNSVTLVATGSVWKYLDTGSAPSSDWTTVDYDDTGWKSGPGKLGYGVGDEATQVSYGPNPSQRYITTWFRQRFVVEDVSVMNHLTFRLRRDDGAVIYLNGAEVYRENLPTGAIQPSTTASADIPAIEESSFFSRIAPATGLVTGTNLIAVEVHQFSTNSPDLSFDLEVVGLSDSGGALVPRITIQRADANTLLSWPSSYSTWLLYSASQLTAPTAWIKSSSAVIASNGWNTVLQSPSNSAAFFELRRSTFCAPFQ